MSAVDRKIRILFVAPLPPPSGGIATWMETLLHNGLSEDFVFRIVNSSLLPSQSVSEWQTASPMQIFRNIRILLLQLKEHFSFQPHIVHLCTGVSTLGLVRDFLCLKLAGICGAATVIHFHRNLPDACAPSPFGSFCKKMVRKLICGSTLQIVLNTPSFTYIKSTAIRCDPVLLPNFIDRIVDPTPFPSQPDPRKRRTCIYAGHHRTAKGTKDILVAASHFPHIGFTLVGQVFSDVREALASAPGNVTLLPACDRDSLQHLYASHDFLLFLSRSEGFPITVLEAMAAGLPVVATSVGAIPEMIDEGKGGFLCRPADLESIRHAITAILQADDLRAMGTHNRAKVQREYLYTTVVKKLEEQYHRIVSWRTGAPGCGRKR